jgi:tetratricopeptide (TPR) repeat protein
MLVTVLAFGQKKELKKAERSIKSGDIEEAIGLLGQAEGMLGAADDEVKTQFYLVKAEAYLAKAGDSDFNSMKQSAEALITAMDSPGSSDFEDRLDAARQNLRAALVNSAIADQNNKNFEIAADKLYQSYMVSKQDTADLYYAAGNAINGKNYDKAIEYYQMLLDKGYTGIRKEYTALNSAGETVTFANENEQKTSMLTGEFTQPGERMTESVQGEILTNMSLIYMAQGKDNEALELIAKARAANPDDITLIRSEADLAYKMNDMEKYQKLMQEVIASDPNNPELYYNLGVGSAQAGNSDDAMKFYQKAIDLDPSYANAKINMAALILKKEGPIIEEMNNLGTSAADNRRYDELKEERKQVYMDAIPYLESASDLRPDNKELVRTLMNIYSQVGEDGKFKAAKAKLESMEGGK